MDKMNHARIFNSVMPAVNHQWAARVLNMQVNQGNGPDLVDERKVIELKFCIFPSSKNYVKWTVLEYQMAYAESQNQCFWGLGTYELNRPVSKVMTRNSRILERMVVSRKLYIVKWDWMKQFQAHHNQGKTERSSWDHSLRHPRFNKLPETIKQYEVEKGLVFLTKGVSEKYFQIQQSQ